MKGAEGENVPTKKILVQLRNSNKTVLCVFWGQ